MRAILLHAGQFVPSLLKQHATRWVGVGLILLIMHCATAWAQNASRWVIRFSHVVAQDTPKGLAAERFKALVEQRSQGQMRVEVYPNGMLYGDHDEIQALALGAVDILAPSLSKFSRLGLTDFDVFDLPFLFEHASDVSKVTQGPVGQELLQKLQRQQWVGLGFMGNGFKHMSANKPLLEPSDYVGLKMRVQTSRVIAQQMRSLGATPVALSFSETHKALAKGIVQGTENPLSNFWTQRMHEVQSHITLTAHGYLGYAVITHQRFWNSLPKNMQDLIAQAMKEALEFGNLIAEEQNEKALKAIQASGKTQIHPLSAEQRQRLKAAVKPVYDQWTRQHGQRLLDAIRASARSRKN